MPRYLTLLLTLLVSTTLHAAEPASKPSPPAMPPPAQAPVRTFSLDQAHGDLLLRAPTTWDYEVRPHPDPSKPPMIEFSTGQRKGFAMQIVPFGPPADAAPDTHLTPEIVRQFAEKRRKLEIATSKETSVEFQELNGEHAAGHYFTITDKNPKPGQFAYMTCAAVQAGDLLLDVAIFHHAKDSPERTAALEALKSATYRPAAKDAPAVLRIPSPIPAAGDLLLPAGKLRVESHTYTAARRTTEVMALDEASGLTVSVWMEPAVKPGGDATAVRALYWGRGQQSPIPKKDVKLAKQGDYATVEYMVPDIAQKNLNVYAAKSGLWVDVHLSKVDYTEKDHPLFTTTATGIKFDTPAK